MEKTNNASLYWYVFYNDQLLLQKKAEGYVIPCTDEAPVTVARSLPVEMQDGTMADRSGFYRCAPGRDGCFHAYGTPRFL